MGYLMVDSRISGGKFVECDTASCRHCQAIIRIVKGQRKGAYCIKCAGPVCLKKRCSTRCEPFFRKLERKIKEDVRARQMKREYGI